MKLKFSAFAWMFLGCSSLFAQDPVAQQYGNRITSTDLKEYLSILASDAMEGRETGKRGQKMAAAFISAHFEEIGLAAPVNGSYYQPVPLYTSVPAETFVKAGQTQYKNFEDIIYYGNADSGGEVSLPLVYAGKGRAEDFVQVDVKDKAVLMEMNPDENFRGALTRANEGGARMAFLYAAKDEDFKTLLTQFKGFLSGGGVSLNKPKSGNAGAFILSPAVAAKALNTTLEKMTKAANEDSKKAALKKVKPGNVTYKTSIEIKTLKTENVLGYLEGGDKKDELIVVTAHYDHIGKRKSGEGDLINNGADDDGSGTVTVLELAKIFAQAKKEGKGPRRSMLFMTVTGEEKGLLGSEYY